MPNLTLPDGTIVPLPYTSAEQASEPGYIEQMRRDLFGAAPPPPAPPPGYEVAPPPPVLPEAPQAPVSDRMPPQATGLGQDIGSPLPGALSPQDVAPEPLLPDIPKAETPEEAQQLGNMLQQRAALETARIASQRADKEGEQTRMRAAQQRKNMVEREQMRQKNEAQLAQRMAQLDDERQAILNSTPDPKRFWRNASTKQKVLSGLQVIASGLATTYGGENEGLKLMDKMAQQDLDAQIRDAENKKWAFGQGMNLYQMNLARLKDKEAAQAETHGMLLDIMATEAKGELQKYDSKLIQQNLLNTIGQLEERKAEKYLETVKRQADIDYTREQIRRSKSDSARGWAQLRMQQAEHERRMNQGPAPVKGIPGLFQKDGTPFTTGYEKADIELLKKKQARRLLDGAFQEYISLVEKYGEGKDGTIDWARLKTEEGSRVKSAYNDLKKKIAQATQMGANWTEMEARVIDSMLGGDATEVRIGSVLSAAKQARRSFVKGFNDELRASGYTGQDWTTEGYTQAEKQRVIDEDAKEADKKAKEQKQRDAVLMERHGATEAQLEAEYQKFVEENGWVPRDMWLAERAAKMGEKKEAAESGFDELTPQIDPRSMLVGPMG